MGPPAHAPGTHAARLAGHRAHQHRADPRGAATARPDPRLTAAAQAHSDDMVARDFYSHTSPEEPALGPRRRRGATHRGIGENIACGQRTPAEVVRGWMNSPDTAPTSSSPTSRT
ncbi:CAP domain-containing protein [Streptomyces sp. M19]